MSVVRCLAASPAWREFSRHARATRRGAAPAVLLAGALLIVAAVPDPRDSGAVPIYSGNHPDFGRIVFALPTEVPYRVSRDGDRVTVRFTPPLVLGSAPAPPRNVLSIQVNASQAELTVTAGASLHDMRMGTRLVLDVFDPVRREVVPSPPPPRPAVAGPAPRAPQALPSPQTGHETGSVPPGSVRASIPPRSDTVARSLVTPDLPGNPPGADVSATAVVARRGDIKLTVADVRAMLDHAEPEQRALAQARPAALAEFVRNRVRREVVLAEARAANWDRNPGVIARANDAADVVIVQTYLATHAPVAPDYPGEADIAANYEANKARFALPKQYHIAEIVIYVPDGATQDANDDALRRARDLRQQALSPQVEFADLARRNSQDRATAERGGDLGWLRADQIVPALRDVVTALPDNAISEPVRSAEAWLVIKLLGTTPPSVQPLEQVREILVQALRQAAAQQAARAYVERLLRRQPIQIDEIGLAGRIAAAR